MSKERELLQRCLDEFEYKGVACNELCIDINKLLAQPEQDNIQYLLDQVARLTAENAMLKEKWSTPKREPLSHEHLEALVDKYHGYPRTLVRTVESIHGIKTKGIF